MFFFLSKTLSYLAKPLVIILLLLFFSAFLRNGKWKVRLFWLALTLLIFFSNEFIANEVMRAWEVPVTPLHQVTQTYSIGIVLTGVTSTTQQPHDRVYFNKGADRVFHTFQLYKLGKIRKILVSGGNGRLTHASVQEADDLKEAFLLMGVASDDLIIENQSRNTYESAHNVKAMISESKDNDLLLITSAFHMRRSLACFRKAEIQTEAFSADVYSHPREFSIDVMLIPKVEALVLWQILFKEWIGMVAYKVAGHI
ncbi:MAG: YdcF family protein [Cyclobacteriaceae bacterium]|nr:YdcF family protein [Cyclobacteriaceae bacterium]